MKSLILGLAFLIAQAPAHADVDSKAIEAGVKALGRSLNSKKGPTPVTVKGDTVRAMLVDYCLKGHCDDSEYPILNNENFDDADETSYGSTSMNAALASIRSFRSEVLQYTVNEVLNDSKLHAHYLEGMKLLQGSGAEFGYNGSGESACGMVFTTILVIDVKKKVIYELGRGIRGPC